MASTQKKKDSKTILTSKGEFTKDSKSQKSFNSKNTSQNWSKAAYL